MTTIDDTAAEQDAYEDADEKYAVDSQSFRDGFRAGLTHARTRTRRAEGEVESSPSPGTETMTTVASRPCVYVTQPNNPTCMRIVSPKDVDAMRGLVNAACGPCVIRFFGWSRSKHVRPHGPLTGVNDVRSGNY